MRIIGLWLLTFAILATGEPEFITFPSDVDWVTRESAHFTALYRRGQDPLALRSLALAERAHKLLTPIFPEGPEKTWMVLADFSDSTNGYALNVPYPHMVIFAAPPEGTGLLAGLDDWLGSVILHEYTHILHIYPARGLWAPMRSFFGSWVMPNALMPSHFHEGIATLLETEMSGGGRGRGAAFRMYRRKAVEAGLWGKDFAPLDLLDGSSIRWPHGVSPYFFGYQMYDALWKSKGAKGIYRLTESHASNWPFFVNTPVEEVFGVDYHLLWDRIFAKGEEAGRAELEAIKKEKMTKLTYLTEDRGNKWDLVAGPSASTVAFRSASWDRKPELVFYDVKEKKRLKSFDVSRSADEGLCWGGTGENEGVFLTETKAKNGYTLSSLKFMSLPSGKKFQVQVDKAPLEHLHLIACNREMNTVFAYREVGGVGFVHEIKVALPSGDKPGRAEKARQWKVPESDFVSGLAVDGKQDAWIVVRDGTLSQLWRWAKGEAAPVKITEMQGHVYSLRTGDSDTHLDALWDKDGRSEVWTFDTKTGAATKRIALVGGASSFTRTGGRWLLSSYEHGGYDLAEARVLPESSAKVVSQKEQRLAVQRAKAKRVPAAADSISISDAKDYSPWSTLLPRFWIPFLLVVPDGLQVSAWIPGFDIGQRHFYGLYAGYDTRGTGSGFTSLSHSYRFGRSSQLSTGLYFQPSYIIQDHQLMTQWGGNVALSGQLFNWSPNFSLGFNFKKLEASKAVPGTTQYNATPKNSIGPQLTVSDAFGVEQEPGAILPRWGSALSLSLSAYPKALGSTDDYVVGIASWLQYFPVPWSRTHGFFLRARTGYTDGTILKNSFFEGGGELIFSFGRGPFLNRGFVPGSLQARRIVNLNAEYHLLLGRPERGYGLTPVFFRSWELAFVGDLSTLDYGVGPPPARVRYPKEIFRYYYASAGTELKGNFKLGYYLPMSLRVGLYHGFGGDGVTHPKGEPLYFVASVEGSFF